ncbi:MAG TPA: hypothetical protein VEN81_16425 [Planctomycetota bacterium]|nr:hypothetical protein [Planctomycetota bacterium]
MTTEIDNWVGQFLSARGPAEVNIASRPELGRLAGELNTLFWRETEKILARAARENPDRVVFSPDERLLLDVGLLDYRLVPGGDRLRPALLKELYAPGRSTFLYFSEWMAQRFRQYLLYGGMAPPEEQALSHSRLIRDLRQQLYLRLSLLLRDLPGFSPQHIELFVSGRIDETLAAMASMLDRSVDERLAEQRRQLLEIRTRLLTRARERAKTSEELALFDSLRQLDRQTAERRPGRAPAPPAPASVPRSLLPEQREKWIQDELKFVKSALWLGIMGSGLARTYSVLLTGQARITKLDLESIFTLAKECDPTLPDTSAVVIAPYTGGGFYDWDRDTLFAPLVPTRGADHAVVQALATYRILLDQFQQGARLRKDYEAAFGKADDFNTGFVRDYKQWVLGVGRGFKGALDPARYAFFRDRLGPLPATLYSPREWASLTPQETEDLVKQLRQKVNRAEAGFDDYYRLAIAAARDQQLVQAQKYLEGALTLQPMNGRALLAMAQVTLRLGTPDGARARFSECMALAPNTLWSVYAADEAQRL